jgi:hypothetical protein
MNYTTKIIIFFSIFIASSTYICPMGKQEDESSNATQETKLEETHAPKLQWLKDWWYAGKKRKIREAFERCDVRLLKQILKNDPFLGSDALYEAIRGCKNSSDQKRVAFVQELLTADKRNGAYYSSVSTPFTLAIDCCQPAIVRYLYENKDKFNIPDQTHFGHDTPLHSIFHGCDYSNNEQMEFLKRALESGENINSQDFVGRTPLFIAVEHGRFSNKDTSSDNDNLEATRYLLEHGADSTISNKGEVNPYDMLKTRTEYVCSSDKRVSPKRTAYCTQAREILALMEKQQKHTK